MNRGGLVWYFTGFGLLLIAGALIGVSAISFLASLTPLYVSIGLSVAAIACSLVALSREVGDAE
jgi:hypothetical protein